MKTEEKRLFETSPASRFGEAFPIGNGHIGGMVYGDPYRMRIGLNHDTLWAGFAYDPATDGRMDLSGYEKAKKAALAGDYRTAENALTKALAVYDCANYLPLGDLLLDFVDEVPFSVGDYRRTLDLESGIASVEFLRNGSPFKVEVFSSYPASALILTVESKSPVSFAVRPDLAMITAHRVKNNRCLIDGECPVTSTRQISRGSAPSSAEGRHGVRYTAGIGAESDGKISASALGIFIVGATRATVVLSCETSYADGKEDGRSDYTDRAEDLLSRALARSASELKAEHIADVSSLFDRMDLSFVDEDKKSSVPTSERLKHYAPGEDPGLVALVFHYGRYLLIASSRAGSLATNLQGIWLDGALPAWGADYTTNINTEMNYWAANAIGCSDLLEPLESLVRLLAKTGAVTAEKLFGAGGFCAGHNADPFGFAVPTHGLARWSYFPLSVQWLTRELFAKYRYTEDRSYLEKIYPLLAGGARFVLDMLVDDGDYLILCPGTSAENVYLDEKGEPCAVAKSSAFFMSIARETVKNFMESAKTLGKSGTDPLYARAAAAYPGMLPLRVTNDGRIEEWYFGGTSQSPVEAEVHHRHISHLYDLYPAKEIGEGTPKLLAAAKRSLDVRGDEATGWSLAWKMACRAYTKDPEGVDRLLSLLFRYVEPLRPGSMSGGGLYPNLFCAHPPFQIDGNFGFVAAVCEMLAGNGENGEPIPLSGLPAWLGKCGTVRGLCLPGNRAIDFSWKDGKVIRSEIYRRHG